MTGVKSDLLITDVCVVRRKIHMILKIHSIRYLHKSHNTSLLPPKNLHRHCLRLLLGHFHVPGEIANNVYAKVLGGNRGVLWDCARNELSLIDSLRGNKVGAVMRVI